MEKIKKIIYILLIIFVMLSLVPKEMQNDLFFSIASGNKILEKGIQKEEQLVWHQGLEFSNPRWLYDIFITIIHNNFGLTGIYFCVLIFCIIEGLLYYYILTRFTKNTIFSFFITIISMYILRISFTARAQLFSNLFLLIEFYCLEMIKSKETCKKRYIFCLVIIPILYVNMHASTYLIYLVMFLPYIIEYIISKIPFINSDDNKLIFEVQNIKLLIMLLIICALEGLISPWGLTPYTYMFKNMNGLSSSFISELQSLTIFSSTYLTSILIAVVLILIFTRQKIRVSDGLFIIGFSILAMNNLRSLYYFIIVSSICSVRVLIELINSYDFNLNFISDKVKNLGAFICVIIVIVNSINLLLTNTSKDYINYLLYPVKATNYIINNLDIDNMKIYNHFNFGSYLEYKGVKSFIDSRSEVYTPEFNKGCTVLQDWKNVSELDVNYNEIFDKYEINYVLLYSNEPISRYIKYDSKWNYIYQDNSFILYERAK